MRGLLPGASPPTLDRGTHRRRAMTRKRRDGQSGRETVRGQTFPPAETCNEPATTPGNPCSATESGGRKTPAVKLKNRRILGGSSRASEWPMCRWGREIGEMYRVLRKQRGSGCTYIRQRGKSVQNATQCATEEIPIISEEERSSEWPALGGRSGAGQQIKEAPCAARRRPKLGSDHRHRDVSDDPTGVFARPPREAALSQHLTVVVARLRAPDRPIRCSRIRRVKLDGS
jgi:hypothetical protein